MEEHHPRRRHRVRPPAQLLRKQVPEVHARQGLQEDARATHAQVGEYMKILEEISRSGNQLQDSNEPKLGTTLFSTL